MFKQMKIGISTFDLGDIDFQVQLHSMLENNTKPDFIILHYSGMFNKSIKYFRFLVKTFKHYRFKSFSYILNRSKKLNQKVSEKFTLLQNEKNEIDKFLMHVQIIKVKGINDSSTLNKLKMFESSVIVCNSGILKENVLSLTNIIFLNIHTSKLPQYRGMNNVEWALYDNNDVYVTVHKISRGIDEGDILYQDKIDIENKDLKLIEDYRKYCFYKSNLVIGKAINKLIKNEITFIEQ